MPESRTDANDEQLIARIRADSPDAALAFEAVYLQHLDSLVQFAYSFVRSSEVAQDIVADLFTSLWASRSMWEPRSSIRAYLFTAVRNRCINFLRDTGVAERVLDVAEEYNDALAMGEPLAPIDEKLELDEKRKIIRTALDRLSPDRKRAMVLRWQEGLSPVEIAEVMGLPRASVDQLISRGIKALRRLIDA